jgi:hypothetical protein
MVCISQRESPSELDVHLHAPCSARGSADLILIPPCRRAAATHFDFLVRPMGGLYECLEMLQGVWGRVPGALSQLSRMCC